MSATDFGPRTLYVYTVYMYVYIVIYTQHIHIYIYTYIYIHNCYCDLNKVYMYEANLWLPVIWYLRGSFLQSFNGKRLVESQARRHVHAPDLHLTYRVVSSHHSPMVVGS